jgi:hypothetical protein
VRDIGSVIKKNKLLVTDYNRRGVDNDLFNVTLHHPLKLCLQIEVIALW